MTNAIMQYNSTSKQAEMKHKTKRTKQRVLTRARRDVARRASLRVALLARRHRGTRRATVGRVGRHGPRGRGHAAAARARARSPRPRAHGAGDRARLRVAGHGEGEGRALGATVVGRDGDGARGGVDAAAALGRASGEGGEGRDLAVHSCSRPSVTKESNRSTTGCYVKSFDGGTR